MTAQQIKIRRNEWLWLGILSTVLLLLAIVPTLYVNAATPENYAFSGFLVNARDGHSYLAKMQQGYRGQWLFTLPYTAEIHDGIFTFTFYLGLGHVARLVPLSLATWYHITRLLTGALLLLTSYVFVAHFTDDVPTRRWAWGLLAAGSGLGLFAIVFGVDSIDLSVPEAFTFFSILTNPHFPFATALMMVLLLLVFAGPQLHPRWRVILLVAASFMIAIIAPFIAPVLWGALAIGVLGQRGRQGHWPRAQVLWSAVVVAAMSLVLAYDLLMLLTNPAIANWSGQNQTPSPPPIEYLLGFGALLPLAIAGGWQQWRKGSPLFWALVGWLAVVAVLVYAPLSLQRRMVSAIQVPLGVLAGFGIVWLLGRLPRLIRILALAGLLLALLPTNALLLAAILQAPAKLDPLTFYTTDEVAALDWLADNATAEDVVLASASFGNFVPAYSAARVVYGHPFEVLDGEQKLAWVEDYFGGAMSSEQQAALFEDQAVTLVVYGLRERALASVGGPDLSDMPAVFSTETVVIYALSD